MAGTIRAGVMGWPVAHSLSPRLHGYWLEKYRIDGRYELMEVAPDDFPAFAASLSERGYAGGNVTVPHKEAALRAVDEVEPLARRIGAVNTIVVRDDGSLYGRNTDYVGFQRNLIHGAPGWDPTKAPAVVIGAGGSSRAVCVGLVELGAPVVLLANRTHARALELADQLDGPIEVVRWEDRHARLDGAGVVVNTTTQGMGSNPALDLDLDALPKVAVVTDLVYAPLETPLLALARARGNRVVDGLGMLLHQAAPGFEEWFGVAPEVTDELRARVLEGLG